MRYIKMLGLAAIAAAALMAFVGAGSASATELTCNGSKCAVGAVIHANSNGHAILHPPFGTIACNSTVQGEVTDAGSSSTTAKGKINTLTFTGCTNGAIVTVIKPGTLEIHTKGEVLAGQGTLTSSGAEVTVQLFGTHCIFSTNNTDIGTVTTNTASGGSATLDIEATIPRTGGSSGVFCGSTAAWTGSYTTTKPTSLIVH